MTDLEMTKLCAEPMGFEYYPQAYSAGLTAWWIDKGNKDWCFYDPLDDDAQAMALVKKFSLLIFKPRNWQVVVAEQWNNGPPGISIGNRTDALGESDDLNRAIVKCVAKMQAAQLAEVKKEVGE